MMPSAEQLDVLHLEELLWVVTSPVGLNHYDFDFDRFFACRRPWQRPDSVTAIARVGAISDYPKLYENLEREGVRLIHSPAQYRISSELSGWYPLIADLTPRSMVFSSPPSAAELDKSAQRGVLDYSISRSIRDGDCGLRARCDHALATIGGAGIRAVAQGGCARERQNSAVV
jgi:hypothetical protein